MPRKFPRNSREIGRFLREFVSSNPVKFHFFSRELSEALNELIEVLKVHSPSISLSQIIEEFIEQFRAQQISKSVVSQTIKFQST